jgi:hypothetical protein
MKKFAVLQFIFLLACSVVTSDAQAYKFGEQNTSLLAQAFTSNAGGQTAYALKRYSVDHEWTIFANTYLLAAGIPLLGGVYSLRHTFVSAKYPLQAFAQFGLGASTGGVVAEGTLGTTLFYLLRIDLTSHLIINQNRAISWSYPFWTGVSIPF